VKSIYSFLRRNVKEITAALIPAAECVQSRAGFLLSGRECIKFNTTIFEKLKEKNNIKAIILGLILTILTIVNITVSNSDTFYSTKKVNVIKQFDQVETSCLQKGNGTFQLVDGDNYIVLPVKEKYDAMKISIGKVSNPVEISQIKIWYGTANGKWKTENTIPVALDDDNEVLSVKFSRPISGNVKITLEGKGEVISIKSISFYRSGLFVSAKSIIRMVAVFFALLAFFALCARYILGIDNKTKLFFSIIFLGEVFFLINNYFTNNYLIAGYFYPDADDSFMDYFNMLALLNKKDPYYLNASYPALCFVILKFFHNFLPHDLAVQESGKLLRANYIAMLGFVILFSVLSICIIAVIRRIIKNSYKSLYSIILLLSGPLLFTIQRGNLLLISLLFLLVYILFYDSEDKKERYIAYVALAIAAAIKIYPALFGLMTLKKKRYKETIHLAIIGFLIFIIPFYAFSGLDTLKEMLHGLQVANKELTSQGAGHNFSLVNLAAIVSAYIGHTFTISKVVIALITIVLIGVAYLAKKEWHSLFLIATACIWFPEFSFTYVLAFYLPAAFSLNNEREEDTSLEYFNLIMLALLQVPFAFLYLKNIDEFLNIGYYAHFMSYSTLVPNVIIVVMVLKIFFEVASTRFNVSVAARRSVRIVAVAVCVGLVTLDLVHTIYVNVGEKSKDSIRAYIEYSKGELTTEKNYYKFTGKGTKSNPYQISSSEELIQLRDAVNEGYSFSNKYFKQLADIDMSEVKNWEPLGDQRFRSHSFNGIYDGDGHSISNIKCDNPYLSSAFCSNLGGIICNLCICDSDFSGENAATFFAGKSVSDAAIINCYASNNNVNGRVAAGIADQFSGSIINCLSDVKCYGVADTGVYTKAYGQVVNVNSLYGSVDIPATKVTDEDLQYIDEKKTDRARLLTYYYNSTVSRYPQTFESLSEKTDLNIWSNDGESPRLVAGAKLKGAGTIKNPFKVKTIEDLICIRELVNSGVGFENQYIKQTADIDMSAVEKWIPIGNKESRVFKGTYDGNGHKISKLYILSEYNENVGLFGYMNGTVANLIVKDAWVGGNCVGIIASDGRMGTIVNCYADGILYGYGAGGIAYNIRGEVHNCVAITNPQTEVFHGIAGTDDTEVKNVYSNLADGSDSLSGEIIDESMIKSLNSYVEKYNSKTEGIVLKKWVNDADGYTLK